MRSGVILSLVLLGAVSAATALRKSSGSTDRIASTVPVCHITKVGCLACNSLAKLAVASSAVFLACISTVKFTLTCGSLSLSAACSRAG